MAILLTWDMDAELRIAQGATLLATALLGSFLIGLPIALVVHRLTRGLANFSFWGVLGLANLAAATILIPLMVPIEPFGLIFLGVPIVIAANAFAIAGWFFVIKPARASI